MSDSELHMQVKRGQSESPQIVLPELLERCSAFLLDHHSKFHIILKLPSFHSLERSFLKIEPSWYKKASKHKMESECVFLSHCLNLWSLLSTFYFPRRWAFSYFSYFRSSVGFLFLNESTEWVLINDKFCKLKIHLRLMLLAVMK